MIHPFAIIDYINQVKYIDDLSVAYAASDLAICRSGAMTVAELTVTGTPAIFIPYPFAAQDHQMFNARYVASEYAAKSHSSK